MLHQLRGVASLIQLTPLCLQLMQQEITTACESIATFNSSYQVFWIGTTGATGVIGMAGGHACG